MTGFTSPVTGRQIGGVDEPNSDASTQFVDRSFVSPVTGREITYQEKVPYQAPTADLNDDLTDSVSLADYGKSIMSGGAQVAAGTGWLLKHVDVFGVSDLGEAIETLGNDAVDHWNDSMSDGAKNELSKEFVSRDENGEFHWGDASLKTVGLFGAQSLLGTAAGAGIGAGATKVLQVFGNPIGRSALVSAATNGSVQAQKKLKLVDRVLGAAGFGIGEGAVGGAVTGVNVEKEVNRLDAETLMSSPRFKEIYDASDGLMNEQERFEYARSTLASEASTVAGYQSGLVTALLGAPMGAYFGPLFSRTGMGRGGSFVKGVTGEAAQEFGQGGAEALITNKELIKAGDARDLFDDVLNQAVGGAAAGGVLGGVMSTAGGGDTNKSDSGPKQPKGETKGPNLDPLKSLGAQAIEAGVTQEELQPIIEEAVKPGGMLPALRNIRELITAKTDELSQAMQDVDESRPRKRRGGRVRRTPVDTLKEYDVTSSGPAELPGRPETPSLPKKTKDFAPDQDSLLEAIAKLGGLSTEEAIAEGIDPAESGEQRAGIKRVFTKKGVPLDQMAEQLAEAGYPILDENGNYDRNELLERVQNELAGVETTFTPAGSEAQLEREAFEEALQRYEDGDVTDGAFLPERLSEEGEYDPEADVEAQKMEDLYTLAARVDEDHADRILERATGDREVAMQLWELINEKRSPDKRQRKSLEQPGNESEEAGSSAPVSEAKEKSQAKTQETAEGRSVDEKLRDEAQVVRDLRIQALAEREGSLSKSEKSELSQLRRQRDNDVSVMGKRSSRVRESGRPKTQQSSLSGPDRQQQRVLSGERALGDEARASEQYEKEPRSSVSGKVSDDSGVVEGNRVSSLGDTLSNQSRGDDGGASAVDFSKTGTQTDTVGPVQSESTTKTDAKTPKKENSTQKDVAPLASKAPAHERDTQGVYDNQKFGNLEISEELEVAETGEIVTVTQKAQVAFRRAVKRRNVLENLLGCVNG